jgi:hypothetical protein
VRGIVKRAPHEFRERNGAAALNFVVELSSERVHEHGAALFLQARQDAKGTFQPTGCRQQVLAGRMPASRIQLSSRCFMPL